MRWSGEYRARLPLTLRVSVSSWLTHVIHRSAKSLTGMLQARELIDVNSGEFRV